MKRMSSPTQVHEKEQVDKQSIPLRRVVGYEDDEDDEVRDTRQEIAKVNIMRSTTAALESAATEAVERTEDGAMHVDA